MFERGGSFVYMEVVDLWVRLVVGGGRHRSVAFVVLLGVYTAYVNGIPNPICLFNIILLSVDAANYKTGTESYAPICRCPTNATQKMSHYWFWLE